MGKKLKDGIEILVRERYFLAAGVAIVWLWSSHLQAQTNCTPSGSMSIESNPACNASFWINGWFPSTCWSATALNSVTVTDNTIVVHASANVTWGVCLFILVPYSSEVPLDSLPPGAYDVTVYLHVNKVALPPETWICNSTIEVADAASYTIGDIDANGLTTTVDILKLVDYVFRSGPDLQPCRAVGDANCDGRVASADVIAMVSYVFKSGPTPGCL